MVTVSFNFPEALTRNPRIRAAILDAGEFIRDLWLARSPYATGEYARGLMRSGAITLRGGKLEIVNNSKHAGIVEFGFRSYNIGLAMLAKSRGVKISAEGYRYKVIKIDKTPTANYRKESVAQSVQKSYAKLQPIGVRFNPTTRFGSERYRPRVSLKRPLRGGKPRPGPEGVFIISEKAIKENPQKWMMPAREGKGLAKDIQKEGADIMRKVISKIVASEKQRQTRVKGKTPSWYKPSQARAPFRQQPVRRGSK